MSGDRKPQETHCPRRRHNRLYAFDYRTLTTEGTLTASTIRHDYVPLINGSDMNFSHPFVLTYPKNGFPTDTPRPQLFVQNLTGFSHGRGSPIGSVQDNQLWGADWGVLR